MSRGGDEEDLKAQNIELGLGCLVQTPYTSFTLRRDAVDEACASMDCCCW